MKVRLRKEVKSSEEERKKLLEENLRLKLVNELLSLVVYVSMGEDAEPLKSRGWKFSEVRLSRVNTWLDEIDKVEKGREIGLDDEMFEKLMLSLDKLKQMHPEMENLIEETLSKLKLKKKFLLKAS
ncbi:MAG: hypothetical protein ABGX27_08970 [Desulfurobacteriaceae bacterium]